MGVQGIGRYSPTAPSDQPLPVEPGASAIFTVVDAWEWQDIEVSVANNGYAYAFPTGFECLFQSLRIEYTSDAVAGNRQIRVDLRDIADDTLDECRPAPTQAAGPLTYIYEIAPGRQDLLLPRDTDHIVTPWGPFTHIPAGYDFYIRDNNNVSAGDSMVIQILYLRRAT